MESELVAGSFTSVEGIWLIHLGRDFRHNFIPIPLFTDNQPFILYSQNNLSNTHTKHIDTHYHYTRDQVTSGNIKLHYIPHMRMSQTFSPSLYHQANMYNSSKLLESNMFEGVCCDKINMINPFFSSYQHIIKKS